MNKVKIIAHCLVKNEERFIWYSLKSALPYVDKIMVWDTGSTDNTVKIIESLKSPKIEFKKVGSVDPQSFTNVRNQMLKKTPKEYTWLILLDGDEIWSNQAINTATKFARKNPHFEAIVVRTHNLVGDIYHRSPELFGQYQLAGHKGHLNLRLMNLKTIPGLHVDLPHGQQGYFDGKNQLIQNRDPRKIKFLDVYYHHATHLVRSITRYHDLKVPKRSQKLKYILGSRIPKNQIPEVFFEHHPGNIPDVTQSAPWWYYLISVVHTAPKLIKKTFFSKRSGY